MKELKQRVTELASEYKNAMIDLTRRVIRCPSLSGDEEKVAGIYMEEMERLGYDEVFSDEYGNIVGIVRGTIPGPAIMYNGHLDHVDVGDKKEWHGYDPYGGEMDESLIMNEEGTKEETALVIHGRAASDTKSGMACQIYSGAILVQLKKEGYPVKGDYIYSGVVLEEPAEQIGMKGLMEETFVKRGIHVDGVISCEATGLKLYLGHRGRVELLVEVCGVTSHGSAPWLGVNAVNKAAVLMSAVEQKYAVSYQEDEKLGRSSIALTNISCSPGAMCIVPDRCYLTYDRRYVPGETAEDCVREMEEIIEELAAKDSELKANVSIAAVPRTTYTGKMRTVENIKEAWKIEKEHPFVTAAKRGLLKYHEPVSYGYWDFGTDLGCICGKYHIAAIGYSPMQEMYCHRPVDMVRVDFMERALVGNIAIFQELTELDSREFLL